MGFSRQEYWSGLPFPSPRDLPNPGIEPRSPTLQADALTSAPACPALCDPMDCSMPGFPVLHYLPEFAQILVHWVCDATYPLILCHLFSFCLQSFPASVCFPMKIEDYWLNLWLEVFLNLEAIEGNNQQRWLGNSLKLLCVKHCFKQEHRGPLWWSSGWELALQCKGAWFNPWSGNWDPPCGGASKVQQLLSLDPAWPNKDVACCD